MFQYEGLTDETWLKCDVMSEEELKSHMHFVTHVPIKDISLHTAIEPFHHDKPPMNLSIFVLALSLCFLASLARFLLDVLQDLGAFLSMPPLTGQALSPEMQRLMELEKEA